MGKVDDFLRQRVESELGAGETIEGMALLQRPTKVNALGVPQQWEPWLGVGTPTRLLLFATQTGGLANNTAKPVANEMVVWRFDEIERVELGNVGGLTTGSWMRLYPHRLCGPFPQEDPENLGRESRRYDMYSAAHNLDAHVAFTSTFPTWLKEQVDAGAFPMPEARRAEVAAALASIDARRAAEEAEKERKREERAAAAKAKMAGAVAAVKGFKVAYIPAIVGVLFALLSIGGALMVYNEYDRIELYEGFAETNMELARKATSASERKRQKGLAEGNRRDASAKRVETYAYAGGGGLCCFLGMGGIAASGLLLARQKMKSKADA